MFVVLRTYDNYISANLMMQRLEEENIRVHLQDEHSATIVPVGGIKLLVHQEQLIRAHELAASIELENRSGR